jgi:hypothetical protein
MSTTCKQPLHCAAAVFIDIRTPEEHNEGAKRYMKNMPVAFMTDKGPRMNNRFKAVSTTATSWVTCVVWQAWMQSSQQERE